MKLYQFPPSPNCQKVVALAHEVGTPLETVFVDIFKGGTKTPEHLARNPNAKIPVLEDGDFVLWESNAMLGYIAAKANRTDLAPTGLHEKADVERWLAWHASHFGPAIAKVAFERVVKKFGGLGPPDDAIVNKGIEEFERFAKVLDTSLGNKEYVAAGRLTIADFALAPYAALSDACGLSFEPYPKARVWLGRMLARESMKKTIAAVRMAA
jgi:glutathione S-transferase